MKVFRITWKLQPDVLAGNEVWSKVAPLEQGYLRWFTDFFVKKTSLG